MKHRIIRQEVRKDRDGNDEVFLHVQIDDGVELYDRAEWLSPADVKAVLADETAIDGIAAQLAERAVRNRPAQKAQAEHDRVMAIEQVKLETAAKELELEMLKGKVN